MLNNEEWEKKFIIPRPDELTNLVDGAIHYLNKDGLSVPDYKFIVDNEGNERILFTVNALDMSKVSSHNPIDYVSVEEAKANAVKIAGDYLHKLSQNYLYDGDLNERNILMALYKGTHIDLDEKISFGINELEGLSVLRFQDAIDRLKDLSRDSKNFNDSRNTPDFDYESATRTTGLDSSSPIYQDKN